ncbi:MAG TPA: Asp-tRNA(Asn)/Glu-tRNA(Gln) amidotransferase subunit GatC, partial [Gemmatales bacterium]|nr:Asp-tRNA(Asn)/Glu-tRNA(Gln) amidotransferase subunit GatC [Gemmatales bacterium]
PRQTSDCSEGVHRKQVANYLMAVDAEKIRWVAHLARLEFAESDIPDFTDQFNNILKYVDQLESLSVEGVEPLAHALPIHNVFRDDVLTESLPVNKALENAPYRSGEYFGVPAVLD